MRTVPTLLVVTFLLLSASEASAQHPPIFLSAAAEQSWMLNPGQRGPGPIDHGTLAGVAVMFMPRPQLGLEVALSGVDIRPRNLDTGRRFEGRVHNWIGFHVSYLARPGARVRPMVSAGAGIMRSEQRFAGSLLNRPDIEMGFPFFVGGGVLTMVTRRVGLRTEVRMHLGPEESQVRAVIGVGYMF